MYHYAQVRYIIHKLDYNSLTCKDKTYDLTYIRLLENNKISRKMIYMYKINIYAWKNLTVNILVHTDSWPYKYSWLDSLYWALVKRDLNANNLFNIFFRTDPSRLQCLALQLSDKIVQLMENNEKLLERGSG